MLGTTTRDRQSERREATRLEILDAAWKLAREHGLAQLTLRDVADRVGMRAPSLYSHFESKNAIYDGMFAQAWIDCAAVMTQAEQSLPRSPRSALKKLARTFFDFSASDLARHQLMNQRTNAGFTPSPAAYRPAVEVLSGLHDAMGRIGVRDPKAIDLYTALISGLIDAQQANDPGGNRWSRLLDQAIDMYADHVGIPRNARRTR
jgi:AcrR family transcriptional regulator